MSESPGQGSWASVEPGVAQPGLADPWDVRPTEHATLGRSVPSGARRRHLAEMVTAAVVVVATVTAVIVFDGKSGSASGYSAQLGPAGTSPSLQLPQQVGAQTLNMQGVPIWTYESELLPVSSKSTYSTISGTYFDDTRQLLVNVDGIYANGDAQHRGVFSVSPAALESLVTQQLFMTDARQYPAGPDGGLMECGTYGTVPTCVWADQSTLGFVYYEGTPGSMATLAALSATFRSAVERG